MKVGDLVKIKDDWRITDIHYGIGVVTDITDYPKENFTSHKVVWSDTDFLFHGTDELEVISESR